uniref:GDP-fucose protein O-fucosyltransferase 1 n=1 Tax=Caligus rogercresseyi TaxID=217165 RepID=C1BN02_CALRO|nr:GDP-fucose protein O-fucosyltransferase 1 precursor [Caligus rogercresseyi]
MFQFILYIFLFGMNYAHDVKELSPKGYLVFCPCMGRFGNQMDHFLGSLAFAKGLNRTLVLPHLIEYPPHRRESIQIPFSNYFDVNELSKYAEVVPMDVFMKELSPRIWPASKRISFCHSARKSLQPSATDLKDDKREACNAKSGNPFGPFWNNFGIDFVGSELYGRHGLYYDAHNPRELRRWNEVYPPDSWPVLAFTGAPASFPIQLQNVHLHKYLKWTLVLSQKADKWIHENLPNAPFVGIHLRNGVDWKRACELVPKSSSLFSSPQCLGYHGEFGKLTSDICLPPMDVIVKRLKRLVTTIGARSVFIASDSDHSIHKLQAAFKNRLDITFHRLPESNPHMDLIILGKSNHFVGNCVSSFSAFVKRERDALGLPSSFFGFPNERQKDEL